MEDERNFSLVIKNKIEESMSNENNHQTPDVTGTAWLTASNFISPYYSGLLHIIP